MPSFRLPFLRIRNFKGRGGQGPAVNVLSSFPRTFSRPTKSKNHGSNVSECVDYVSGTVLNNLLLNSWGFIMVLSQRRAPFSRWEQWSRVTYVAHLKSEGLTERRDAAWSCARSPPCSPVVMLWLQGTAAGMLLRTLRPGPIPSVWFSKAEPENLHFLTRSQVMLVVPVQMAHLRTCVLSLCIFHMVTECS